MPVFTGAYCHMMTAPPVPVDVSPDSALCKVTWDKLLHKHKECQISQSFLQNQVTHWNSVVIIH